MKKYWIIMMVCLLLLTAGCGKSAEPQATEPVTQAPAETAAESMELPPETTEENVPVPQTVSAVARVDQTPAVLTTAMRGDTVDVVGEYDKVHYVIKTPEGYGLVRREFIRMEGEPAYESWIGYAYWNAEFYTDLYLRGEPAEKLAFNTEVEVLDDLGYCYVVRAEDTPGFMRTDRLSKWRFSSSGSEDGGNSGGGAGDQNGGGQDGGDIALRYQGGIRLLAAIEQTGDVTGTGTILADGTQIVLGYYTQGEELQVVIEEGFAETREGYATVYLNGLYAWVDETLVSRDDEEAFEEWDGYARWSAAVYDNIHLIGSPRNTLNTNKKIRVVYELENCYMVESEEATGFMAKDMVSRYPYSSGGSSGSSDSDASNEGGGGIDWTPPAM